MNIGRNAVCPCGSGQKYKKCCLAHAVAAYTVEDYIMLAMPTRGSVCYETMLARQTSLDGFVFGSAESARIGVVDARNELTQTLRDEVRQQLAENGIKPRNVWVVWHDDDAWWAPGTIQRMVALLKASPKISLLAGWFCKRLPYQPAVACIEGVGSLELGVHCKKGDVVEVSYVGGHFLVHRLELLDSLPQSPWSVDGSKSEDFAFCDRVRSIGGKIAVDTGSLIAHVDAETGACYVPRMGLCRVIGGKLGEREATTMERRSYGRNVVRKMTTNEKQIHDRYTALDRKAIRKHRM